MHDLPLSRDAIEAALQTFDVPGCAVAVVHGDQPAWAAGFGVRTLGSTAPVDASTSFAVGSISKSITATCLAMLVDEGRLRWDDPVLEYLPAFQLADAYATRELTIRDLLTHRSGLREVSGGTIWYGSRRDRAEVLRRLRFLQPVSSFRSRYAYQNVLYLAAGEIIPVVTGQSWDSFVRERLFEPLGMRDSSTSIHELARRDNVATPHARLQGRVQAVAYRDYDNVGPAASVNSSAADMARLLRMFLDRGRVDGRELLRAATVDELWSAQTVIPRGPQPPALAALAPQFLAYGLGWFLRDYHGHTLVSHAGGVDGMTALATLVPDAGLGIVVLSNQQEALPMALTFELLDAYLGLPPQQLVAAYAEYRAERAAKGVEAEGRRVSERVPDTRPALPLERYAGRYTDPVCGDVTVQLEDGGLVLRFAATPAFTGDLHHWHFDTFRVDWRDPMVPWGLASFTLSARGEVAELRFDQPKLLDADFAELQLQRVADTSADAAGSMTLAQSAN